MGKTTNIRSGNMKVVKMKEEISKRLGILSLGYGHARAKRRLEQGKNFLDMLANFPYASCETVSDLTQKISEERDKLKEKLAMMDANMPGHQISLFEVPQEVNDYQQQEIAREQMWLKQEIDWLHKCLGICKNRDYFN